jgi:hypothetical protein
MYRDMSYGLWPGSWNESAKLKILMTELLG